MNRGCGIQAAAFAIAATMAISPAVAQKAKGEPPQEGITRQQADGILNELREMRKLLEKLTTMQLAAPAPAAAPDPVVTLKLDSGVMMGDKNAPVTMVEYIDLQCSFCRQYDDQTFDQIRKNLIDTGKLRYYSRDFPLDMHPFAMKAAVAAHCAEEQGQFWRMRQVLVANAANLGPDAFVGYARTVGLDTKAFAVCLDSGKYDEAIRKNMREGGSVGVQGTPSFVMGKLTAEGVTGSLFVGAQPYAAFEAQVKKFEGK